MKFWQRFNKNTFRGIAAALVVAAAVMGGTDAALAAGEPVTEEQTKIISASLLQAGGTVQYFLSVMIMRLMPDILPDRAFFFQWLTIL